MDLFSRPVAALDLHGMTRMEAQLAVRNFLSAWRKRSPGGVVHIITGKGRGSAGRPVLRPAVRTELKGESAKWVSEFTIDDGDGGYLVMLKK